MDPRDRKEVRALFEAIISGQCPRGSIEYRIERKDGEMRLFRATASPCSTRSGRIEGVIAAARDITESKRMEQQLIQTERLAAMGQMIAGVAHELNNPLTAVLGVTELLRETDHGSCRAAATRTRAPPGSPRRADRAKSAVASPVRPSRARSACN